MRKILGLLALMIASLFSLQTINALESIDFEELFENHQSIMLIIDPETGIIRYANSAAVDFYQYDELIGMSIDDINMLSPEEVAAERLKAASEERNFFIFKHQLANGDIRTVHVYSYPVEIHGETYLYSIIVDQTAYTLTEQRNQILMNILVSLLAVGFVVTGILLFDLYKKHKQLKESEARFEALHNASFGGIAIHDQGRIIECNQGLSDVTGYTMKELKGMDGLLLIAPDYRDFVMGKIKAGYERPYEAFGIRKNKEIYPLRIEARNIPYHGKKVRVVEFRDVTELKRQEKLRQESEEKHHLLYETMAQGVVYQDADGYITDCNPMAEKVLGITLSQMQGKTSMDPRWQMIDENGQPIPGEEHPTMIALKTRKQIGPTVRAVYRPETDDYVWLNIMAIPLFVEGQKKPHQVYATFEDITEKRKMDLELRQRNQMIEGIFNNMKSGLAIYKVKNEGIYGKDYIIQDFNDTSLSWEGKTRDEVIGKPITDLHPDIDRSGIIQAFRKTWKTGKATTFPATRFTRDDYDRWHTNSIFKLPSGEIVAMYHDVTEQKRLELEIIKEKETLSFTLNSIGDAVIATDSKGIITGANPIACHLIGLPEAAMLGQSFSDVFNITFEDERIPIDDPVQKALETNGMVELANHTVLISKDGSRYFIEDTASPIRNAQGETIGVVIVFRDVTEKKEKVREIQYLSEHDYLTGIYNRRYFSEHLAKLDKEACCPIGVLMLDINGLKLINDSFGYESGDSLIRFVAKTIESLATKNMIYARLGGDEFGIIMTNTSEQDITAFKDALAEKIAKFSIRNVNISVAIGHELKTDASQSINDVIIRAEESMLKKKVMEGRSMRSKAIHAILSTLTDKFKVEKVHSEKVSDYCYRIGQAMKLSKDMTEELKLAGLLHDIGKISVPDHVLSKPGKLDPKEWEQMKEHTIFGFNILRAADEYSNLALYALTHHEKYDGTGYPKGLAGEDIPLFSRIICVADAYEAMTADRPYRNALSEEVAISELKKYKGIQFDPKIVDVFITKVLKQDKSDKTQVQ